MKSENGYRIASLQRILPKALPGLLRTAQPEAVAMARTTARVPAKMAMGTEKRNPLPENALLSCQGVVSPLIHGIQQKAVFPQTA